MQKYMRLIQKNNQEAFVRVQTEEEVMINCLEKLQFDDDKWSSDSEDDSITEDKVE